MYFRYVLFRWSTGKERDTEKRLSFLCLFSLSKILVRLDHICHYQSRNLSLLEKIHTDFKFWLLFPFMFLLYFRMSIFAAT